MREIIEFRIGNAYAHLLLSPGEGKKNGSNTIIHISKDDPKFEQIRILNKQIREKSNDFLFLYSNIKRVYSKKELDRATLLQVKIKTTFEPAGEQCGTIYDEKTACEICGANRKQIGPLILKRGSIPKKDIARTIAGELVVSEKFAATLKKWDLKGTALGPMVVGKVASGYHQLFASSELDLTGNTLAGVNLFDFSEGSEPLEFTISGGFLIKLAREVYKCPKGHTIGLNLLSEAHVQNSLSISSSDFFASTQKTGVKRGVLCPEPLYFCSQAFKRMIEEEKLNGFEFEVANIE